MHAVNIFALHAPPTSYFVCIERKKVIYTCTKKISGSKIIHTLLCFRGNPLEKNL